MDGGAWWAAVHGVAKSRTRLSDFTFHFQALEKEMATHSSVLAWRIPGTGEPGGLRSMGSHRVGHEWNDLAAAAQGAGEAVAVWDQTASPFHPQPYTRRPLRTGAKAPRAGGDWPAGALAPRTRWRRPTPSTWTRRTKRTAFSRVKGVHPAGSLRRQDPETHLRKRAICGVSRSASLCRPWHPSIANFLSRKPRRTSLWSLAFLSRRATLTGDIK